MKLDGRKKAVQLLPRQPLKLTNAQVKKTIEDFEKFGCSNHSGNAGMLQYIIDYCEENKINYSIVAWPGKGYYIKKEIIKYPWLEK